MPRTAAPSPELSVILPARDEATGLRTLLPELAAVLGAMVDARALTGHEVIVVDDGSVDETAAVARAAGATVVATPAQGQSAAMASGVTAARGRLIAFLDADGQNDPADLPALLGDLRRTGADLVQGDRSATRCDGPRRRLASAIGRAARLLLLGDPVRDTGCTLRIMRREVAAGLPLQEPGMHRFVPVLARAAGATVIERPVGHRPRAGGRSHYGLFGRALPGLRGCLRVRRLRGRATPADAATLTPPPVTVP